MNIQQYIATGIIESYALGLASPDEAAQFERLLPTFPELKIALTEFEFRLESFVLNHEIPPPPGLKDRIEGRLRGLPAIRNVSRGSWSAGQKENEYIHARESSPYIKIHKYWRWAFIAVFIISKIWLTLFIYYLMQYRLAAKEIRHLQERVRKEKPFLQERSPDNQP